DSNEASSTSQTAMVGPFCPTNNRPNGRFASRPSGVHRAQRRLSGAGADEVAEGGLDLPDRRLLVRRATPGGALEHGAEAAVALQEQDLVVDEGEVHAE